MNIHKPRIFIHNIIRKAFSGSSLKASINNRLYDLESIAIMKQVLKDDSNCIDIGCHKGEIMDKIIQLSPNGNHFGFEPLPDLFQNLQQKYSKQDKIKILPFALSTEKGTSEFVHVKSNPAYSGIRQRKFDRPNEELEKIQVIKDRLDALIPENSPIQLIKIDVEGGEYDVIKGAEKLIKQWKPNVIFEHGLGAADCYNTKPEMIFDLFLNFGLKISNLDQYLLQKSSLSKAEFSEQFNNGVHYYFIAHP